MNTPIEKIKENNFNLLRLIFASMVIFSHVPELKYGNRNNEILTQLFGTLSFGELAVDSFFILSGFLIVKSWVENPNIFSFLSSRILRIYPGFILSSLICVFAIGSNYSNLYYFRHLQFTDFFIGLAQLQLLVFSEVFPNTNYPMLNGSMWTIPYEFKCYLLILSIGILKGFNKKYILLTLFLTSTITYILAISEIIQIPFFIYFRFFMAFSAGGCFYLYQDNIIWKNEIALSSLLLSILCLFSITFAEPGISIFFGYAIIYYAKFGKKLLNFNRFPDVSYGVYLYAWPINKIVLWYFPNINVILAVFIVLTLSLFAGTISWHLIEKPFLKLKSKIRK